MMQMMVKTKRKGRDQKVNKNRTEGISKKNKNEKNCKKNQKIYELK